MHTPINDLHALDQSIWYDNIQRRLLKDGTLAGMIARDEIRGITSNPSIFNKAIAQSDDYDEALIPLAKAGKTAEEIYESLAIEDIRGAADLFLPLYKATNGGDGYVSLEVSPHLARDTAGTCAAAARLWKLVDRPNLMIKIPATVEGLPAITETIARGINVNATLIFSQSCYTDVAEAYISGLEKRQDERKPLDKIASVASFFVSRIDAKADKILKARVQVKDWRSPLASALQGRVAVANAKNAYQKFEEIFNSERWFFLLMAGATLQRPLWASTSTKNPAYSDVKYIEELIGPKTINTVPPHTLDAFRDHGTARLTLESGQEKAGQAFEELRALAINFQDIAQELEEEGVAAFAKAYDDLLETIEQRRKNVLA